MCSSGPFQFAGQAEWIKDHSVSETKMLISQADSPAWFCKHTSTSAALISVTMCQFTAQSRVKMGLQ